MLPAVSVITGPTASPSRALHVLVVDDDADSRELLGSAVTALGHRWDGAPDGVEAWAAQKAQTFDVILSDWNMPGMSGIELCRQVRSEPSSEYTYFVFMTGFGDRAHLLEGLRAGADDFLTKPVDLEELEVRLLSAARVVEHQRGLARVNAVLREESELSFEAARVDPLTHVANRLRLREDLDAIDSQAARYGHHHSAALCDIDLFKSYNDTYGHLAGDDALRRVAASIRGALRQGDALYRYGGEEFLAILFEQGVAEAGLAMDRVRGTVEGLGIPHSASSSGVVTISVGIAQVGVAGARHENWLRLADKALYRAKAKGRNRVERDDTLDASEADAPAPASGPAQRKH